MTVRRLLVLLVAVSVALLGAAWAASPARAVEDPSPDPCDMVCTLQGIAWELATGFENIASGIGQGLHDGFNDVAEGLETGFQHLQDGFGGLGEALGRLQDGVLQGIIGAAQGIADAIHGLQQFWDGLGDALRSGLDGIGDKINALKDALGRAVTPNQGAMDGFGSRIKSALGRPFDAWGDALGSMAAAWSGHPAGCAGPAMPIPYAPGKAYVMHPLSACDEPQRTLAGIVRLAVAVVMISAAAWTTVRSIAAGFGYAD